MKNLRLSRGTMSLLALAATLVAATSVATYFVCVFSRPYEVVGIAVERDLGGHTVSLRLLKDDRANDASVDQIFNYTVDYDDLRWVKDGDIVVARVKGSKASIVSLRSSFVEAPLLVYHESYSAHTFAACLAGIKPIPLPKTFTVFRRKVEGSDFDYTRGHTFGVFLHPDDRIRITFNATEPIHFEFGFTRKFPPEGIVSMGRYDTMLVDEPSISYYGSLFTAQEDGLYQFEFHCTPEEADASVAFDCRLLFNANTK